MLLHQRSLIHAHAKELSLQSKIHASLFSSYMSHNMVHPSKEVLVVCKRGRTLSVVIPTTIAKAFASWMYHALTSIGSVDVVTTRAINLASVVTLEGTNSTSVTISHDSHSTKWLLTFMFQSEYLVPIQLPYLSKIRDLLSGGYGNELWLNVRLSR